MNLPPDSAEIIHIPNEGYTATLFADDPFGELAYKGTVTAHNAADLLKGMDDHGAELAVIHINGTPMHTWTR